MDKGWLSVANRIPATKACLLKNYVFAPINKIDFMGVISIVTSCLYYPSKRKW